MKNYYKTFTKGFWSITEATIDCKVTDELLQKHQQTKQTKQKIIKKSTLSQNQHTRVN